jgi:RNA polymerase sigma-70 factor (ECF subfamily)
MMSLAFEYTNQRDTALDWVSQAYVRIFLNLKKFDQNRALQPWMKVILKNVIHDDLRKRAREIARWVEDRAEELPTADLPTDSSQFSDLREVVDRELDHMGEEFKRVFVLHVVEGYSHKEIAAELGMAVGTSRWYLSEAKRKLQGWLTKNDYRHG